MFLFLKCKAGIIKPRKDKKQWKTHVYDALSRVPTGRVSERKPGANQFQDQY